MNCSANGCTKAATKQPAITFTAKGHPNAARAKAVLYGIQVCEDHSDIKPDEVMTDEGWSQLVGALRKQGAADPDRASIRIEYEPLH